MISWKYFIYYIILRYWKSIIAYITLLNFILFPCIVLGMDGLSITMGRGGLRWYTGAQVTTGQSVEARYSIVQQVSKSYFDVYYTRRVWTGLQRQLNGLICIWKFRNKWRVPAQENRQVSCFYYIFIYIRIYTKLQFKTNYNHNP